MTALKPEQAITIQLSATLRDVAGAREVAVPHVSGATVRELLRTLSGTHPGLVARLLDNRHELNPGIQIIVNGRHIDFLQGLETPLSTVDTVLLIPPVGGG
jgi:molybdopterin synthase sulfur carrier subunit